LNFGLFIDRDGTVNVENHFIKDPEELQLIPGSADAIREARSLGFKVIVVSNQSGIARGFMTDGDVQRVNDRLVSLLEAEDAAVDDIYYCPHYPENGTSCACRKPEPGMFLQARDKHDIDFKRSFMIGDRLSDMEAGRRIGATTILVLTGYGETLKGSWEKRPDVIDHIARSLDDSMPFIKQVISEWKSRGTDR
jgi:D-glycero-D-manno-heptose 1,7-bisphosphate phosphatase